MISATADSTTSDDTEKKQGNLIPFKKGVSGNPAGRPKGSRNRLTEDFIHAFAEDFEKHGMSVIERCREESPKDYLKVAASLLPRSAQIDLSDDTMRNIMTVVDAYRIIRDTQPMLVEAETIEEQV